jgi:hypothetical protein
MRTTAARFSARSLRSVNRAIVTAVVSASVAMLMSACMMFAKAPADLDYSRTRVSEGGAYRATIQPAGDSIPKGRLHSWTLHIETAAGAPVDSATVLVDGGMPQHGHGLPTKPRARAVGQGDYAIDGMKFNMGGWWVVKFRVQSGAGRDSLVFNVKL